MQSEIDIESVQQEIHAYQSRVLVIFLFFPISLWIYIKYGQSYVEPTLHSRYMKGVVFSDIK